MNFFKKLFSLLILFTCTFGACINNQKDNNKPDFKVSATLGGLHRADTSEIVYIVGKLFNLSNDTLSFLSMTCSWDDSWKITSPNMMIVKNICYVNVPILVKLGPNESMLNYIPVRLLKPSRELWDENFLVGFNLVKTDTVEFSQSIEDLNKTNNFFWSDTMQLNKLFRFNTITKEK